MLLLLTTSRSSRFRYFLAAALRYLVSIFCVPVLPNPLRLKKSRAFLFPPLIILFSSHLRKPSMSMERTKLTCTPRLRWTPLQPRHKKMPKLTEHHVGLRILQSKHSWFEGSFFIRVRKARATLSFGNGGSSRIACVMRLILQTQSLKQKQDQRQREPAPPLRLGFNQQTHEGDGSRCKRSRKTSTDQHTKATPHTKRTPQTHHKNTRRPEDASTKQHTNTQQKTEEKRNEGTKDTKRKEKKGEEEKRKDNKNATSGETLHIEASTHIYLKVRKQTSTSRATRGNDEGTPREERQRVARGRGE